VNLIHAIITELISKTEVNFLLIDFFKKMFAGTLLELKYYCSHIGLQQDQELLLCVLCRQDSHGHGLWRKCPVPCSRLCGKHLPTPFFRRILLYIYTCTSAGYTVWLGIFIPQAVKPTVVFRLVKSLTLFLDHAQTGPML